jgi:A/G-specific adenine glycosylase
MDAAALDLDANWLKRFRSAVRRWYPRHARDLSWRRTTDPYCIWISEIMLQQTTVKAVVPYYERFIARFPSVKALAVAKEDDVLRHWEGLGYYSRARNLHKAARDIQANRGGRFPATVEQLLALPGIGRYTAGAIASFAFDVPAPIVEANTLRLYCRLMGFADDPRSREGQNRLWNFASTVVPRQSPGEFNQALMELGATVCKPIAPRCEQCPVKSCCRAFADGTQETIPQTAKRPEVTEVTEAAVAVRKGRTWLLRKRDEGERWAGLWDFPRFAIEHSNESIPVRALERQVSAQTGLDVRLGDKLTEIAHSVTRYRIRLLCFAARHRSGVVRSDNLKWVSPRQFEEYPLSVTGRKFARLLEKMPANA